MPNNITHLPTDETLESGLSLIAQALDGDKISQISAKLSSQSKSLSQIDSFLADNLSGINTKLVAKGSTAASLYSEIPGKIESIEAASTPFRLLKNVTTPTVVTNGSFTVGYEGTPPADLQSNYQGTILLPGIKNGVVEKNIYYSITGVDRVNNTITFTLSGQTDGVISAGTPCIIAIVGQNSDILSSAIIVALNLPVNYDTHLVQPQGARQIIEIDDTTTPLTICLDDVLSGPDCIVPKGVSPSNLAGFNIDAFVYIYDPTTDTITQVDCTVSGTNVTVPVDGLVDGAQLNVWLNNSNELNSSVVLFLQEV